jgi:hypothetical protein
MKLITAEKARELSNKDTTETICRINALILSAASKGENHVRLPYDMTVVNGYSVKLKSKQVENELVAARYTLTAKSEDRQFVDLWLEVNW